MNLTFIKKIMIVPYVLGMIIVQGNYAIDSVSPTLKPNLEMLRRIGITDPNFEFPRNTNFSIAVIDSGNIYQHPLINAASIHPAPLPHSSSHSAHEEHGLYVCSILHQLNPFVAINYYEDNALEPNDKQTLNERLIPIINMALDNASVKIINCSFSICVQLDKSIFEKAQKLGKLIIFSAGNNTGWLGVKEQNRYLLNYAHDPETTRSFGIVGGSHVINNQEAMIPYFMKAGGLRSHYIMAPGDNLPVATHSPHNGQINSGGTSFSAPQVSICIAYLMSTDNLSPYDAFTKLYESATQPCGELGDISEADQGAGYLNLGRAIEMQRLQHSLVEIISLKFSRVMNKFSHSVSPEFEDLYDHHMGLLRTVPSFQDTLSQDYSKLIPFAEYPQTLVDKIRDLYNKNTHNAPVKQLYRTALFERGTSMALHGIFNPIIFQESQSLGLRHTDPILLYCCSNHFYFLKDRCSFVAGLESPLKWHQGLVKCLEYSAENKNDVLDDEKIISYTHAIRKAILNGYEGGEETFLLLLPKLRDIESHTQREAKFRMDAFILLCDSIIKIDYKMGIQFSASNLIKEDAAFFSKRKYLHGYPIGYIKSTFFTYSYRKLSKYREKFQQSGAPIPQELEDILKEIRDIIKEKLF